LFYGKEQHEFSAKYRSGQWKKEKIQVFIRKSRYMINEVRTQSFLGDI